MSSIDDKIFAMTKLQKQGIISKDELKKIIIFLEVNSVQSFTITDEMAKKYENFMKNQLIPAFSSNRNVLFPPLNNDILHEEIMEIKSVKGGCVRKYQRYIETYIDEQCSYQGYCGRHFAIIIDENFNFLQVLLANKDSFADCFTYWVKIPKKIFTIQHDKP